MTQQKHLVFGAGLIGGYLAGCFLSQGLQVRLVGRVATQDKLKAGLTISDYQRNHYHSPAPLFASPDDKSDVIWLTVKCTAIDAVINDLRAFVGPHSLIICCQNGFGSDQAVRTAFPNNTVLNTVVGFNVVELASAHLQRSTQGDLVIESHPDTQTMLPLLQCKLLPVHVSDDINAERWAKLQLNLANPVNALANVPVKEMIENAGYRKIISALMHEHLRVVDALGMRLPKVTSVPGKMLPTVMNLPNFLFKLLAQKMLAIDPQARTSMWWDLTQQRKTEIDYINGAVLEQAAKLGIACPVNTRIIDLIHQVERGEQSIGFSARALQQQLLN